MGRLGDCLVAVTVTCASMQWQVYRLFLIACAGDAARDAAGDEDDKRAALLQYFGVLTKIPYSEADSTPVSLAPAADVLPAPFALGFWGYLPLGLPTDF